MVMFYGKPAPNGQFSTGRLSWRNGVFRDNDPAGWIIWGKGMDIWRLGERSNNQILEGKPGGMMQQKSQIKYQLFINNLPCQTILQLDLPFTKVFPCLVLALLYKVLLARRSRTVDATAGKLKSC